MKLKSGILCIQTSDSSLPSAVLSNSERVSNEAQANLLCPDFNMKGNEPMVILYTYLNAF